MALATQTIEPTTNQITSTTRVQTPNPMLLHTIQEIDAESWILINSTPEQQEYQSIQGSIRIINSDNTQIREYHAVPDADSDYIQLIYS